MLGLTWDHSYLAFLTTFTLSNVLIYVHLCLYKRDCDEEYTCKLCIKVAVLGYQTAAIALKMTALSMKLILALNCISAFCLETGVADTCPATASVQCIPAWSAWKRWEARTPWPK